MKGISAAVLWVLVIFLVILAVVVSINMHMNAQVENQIYKISDVKNQDADAIIVLGAKVHEDGRPSLMLKDRLDCAYNLYRLGLAPKIICSGDHGQESYDETGNMKVYLVSKGVSPDDIFEDHAGFATYDTVYRAGYIFGVTRACYVSQKYHLYRTLYISNALDQTSFGVVCDTKRYPNQSMRDMRELMAQVKDFVKARIKPYPKYLGPAIDLQKSGAQTDDK